MSNEQLYDRVSPSRTYVAACFRGNFAGYFFKKYVLPENIQNDVKWATWYYLNRIDPFSAIDGVFTFEDFSDVTDAKT